MKKHKVFISYHHHKSDYKYRKIIESFSEKYDIFDSLTVKIDEIGEVGTEEFRRQVREKHLRESTVTIVLIGRCTWSRKHVDYEIYNTLRETDNNLRSGLIGIILPNYPKRKGEKFNPRTIPKRLSQNLENKYANIHNWTDKPEELKKWIHDAFKKRKKINPNNTMPIMKNNWKGEGWS